MKLSPRSATHFTGRPELPRRPGDSRLFSILHFQGRHDGDFVEANIFRMTFGRNLIGKFVAKHAQRVIFGIARDGTDRLLPGGGVIRIRLLFLGGGFDVIVGMLKMPLHRSDRSAQFQ